MICVEDFCKFIILYVYFFLYSLEIMLNYRIFLCVDFVCLDVNINDKCYYEDFMCFNIM